MVQPNRITIYLNIFLVCMFLLLVFKDPFSQRTLIPNLEPYPDTFNYLTPALNFIKGNGFNMNREGREMKSNVPALYSITLIPALILKSDPRMAYYANVIIALFSFFLFLLILKKIFSNKIIIYSLIILYITNYFIYWMPTLVMAENLTLTLYLAALYLLISNITITTLILMPLTAISLYATKYANIPCTISLILLYILKILLSKKQLDKKYKHLVIILTCIIIFLAAFGILDYLTRGNNNFDQILGHLSRIYNSYINSSIGSSNVSKVENYQSSWFGIEYISKNLPQYAKSVLGNPNRFLWDQTPIIPNYIGILGVIGLVWACFRPKMRFIALSLITPLTSLILFMSTFYSFDARYIYIAIPTLIVAFGLFLTGIESLVMNRLRLWLSVFLLIFIGIYLFTNFTRLKSQISLNLKYAETPWNYVAILKMNEYFTSERVTNEKLPILISALNPYLIDYYSNGNFHLLPLSYEQDLRGEQRVLVWGPNDYSDLPKLYTKYLKEGYNMYVSRAGLGNEGYTNRDFNTIVKEFKTELVLSGCYEQCNIYSVKLKENGN